MKGWIKLHRKIRNHWIFTRPDYFTAWVTILFDVNHEEKHVLIKSKLLVCGRGESLNSLDTWAKSFGNWSKSKVQRFFQLLVDSEMIVLQNETVTTRLSVCNYETYQDSGNASDIQIDTRGGRERYTNKNEKECKELKKKEERRKNINERFEKFWSIYGKKFDRSKCEDRFSKMTDLEIELALRVLPSYIQKTPDVNFRKNPLTWLNGKCWKDEIESEQVVSSRIELLKGKMNAL